MKIRLDMAAEWAGGRLAGPPGLELGSVVADSRLCKPGALFVGISGPNFDGNAFVRSAFEKGAVAALVEREESLDGLPGIVAPESIAALGRLAASYRQSRSIPWVGLTGSNGKTTTRELLACILRSRGPVACSMRNYNNNIGVPLSILSAPDDAWAGVIELGTSGHGEIAALSAILRPTAGIITMVGRAHLAGLGSAGGVALEKGALFSSLPPDGLAVLPAEGPGVPALAGCIHCARRTFAIGGQADLVATGVTVEGEGLRFRAWEQDFRIPLLGEHNVRNALAAIATADWLGVTPAQAAEALTAFRGVPGRLALRHCGALRLIDDTYNANPESLRAAVGALMALPAKRRVAIVGAMKELGEESDRIHRESGRALALAGVDVLLAIGRETVGLAESAASVTARCKVHYFPSLGSAVTRLRGLLQAGDLILVKGSRASQMERIVGRIESLVHRDERQAAGGSSLA